MSLTIHYDFSSPTLEAVVGPPLVLTRASDATVIDYLGIIRTVDDSIARFPGGRVVENRQVYSQDFDITTAGWLAADCTATADAAVAPDGTTTADLMTATVQAGAQTPVFQDGLTLPRVGTWTISCYMKAGTVPYGVIYTPSFDVSPLSIFDLSGAGSVLVTGTGADSAGIELATVSYPGAPAGWYRVWHTMTLTSDIAGTLRVAMTEETTVQRITDPDGTETMYFWGAQVEDVTGEADSTPSEYVATGSTPAAQWFNTQKDGTALSTAIEGLLAEDARTNICTYSEDLSNAAWVVSNVTKGGDSVTTPAGNASTTVRLTSTAANGTVLQSITSASANRSFAVYMKRITGTGDIDLTVDGGTTWTTKTLTSSWQRFDIQQAAVTDPQVGVRIVTSGDAIDFWGAQLEAGTHASSYIPTTTASVTRVIDNHAATLTTEGTNEMGTLVYTAIPHNVTTEYIGRIGDGTNANRIYTFYNSTTFNVRYAASVSGGGGSLVINDTAYAVTAGVAFTTVLGYDTDDVAHWIDGVANGIDTTFGPGITAHTKFSLGLNNTTTGFNGVFTGFRFYDTRLTDAELEDASNGIFPSAAALVSIGYPRDAMPLPQPRFLTFISDAGGTSGVDIQTDYKNALAVSLGYTEAQALQMGIDDLFKEYYETL